MRAKKERPIIFTGQMVTAIIQGRKTQTRRVVKAPAPWHPADEGLLEEFALGYISCPYGKRGETMWVRESFRIDKTLKPHYMADSVLCVYKWKPSIHMPRWASRINLEIVDVRMERLQDISEADARAEGCFFCSHTGNHKTAAQSFYELWNSINAKRGYAWSENVWVYVITFRRKD